MFANFIGVIKKNWNRKQDYGNRSRRQFWIVFTSDGSDHFALGTIDR